MGFLGFLGGSGEAGADSPDGFVGNDDVGCLFGRDVFQTAGELCGKDFFESVAEAFVLGLTDAEDGSEAIGDGLLDLGVDDGIGFTVVLATFAVAENDVGNAKFLEHRGGDFTGECAVVLIGNVLGGDSDDRIALELGNDGGNSDEGRGDHNVAGELLAVDVLEEFIDEGGGFSRADVHFPVGCNDGFAGHG